MQTACLLGASHDQDAWTVGFPSLAVAELQAHDNRVTSLHARRSRV
jgi:hypothetical protein